jgi:hypothetical protein
MPSGEMMETLKSIPDGTWLRVRCPALEHEITLANEDGKVRFEVFVAGVLRVSELITEDETQERINQISALENRRAYLQGQQLAQEAEKFLAELGAQS